MSSYVLCTGQFGNFGNEGQHASATEKRNYSYKHGTLYIIPKKGKGRSCTNTSMTFTTIQEYNLWVHQLCKEFKHSARRSYKQNLRRLQEAGRLKFTHKRPEKRHEPAHDV